MTFDTSHQDENLVTLATTGEEDEKYNPAVSEKKTQSNDWELDVRSLISSKKWLQNYGLKKNKMTMHQLLPTIGFKHSDGK